MTFSAYFGRTRRRLLEDLDRFLAAKRKDLAPLRPWGRDVIRRLAAFTRKGKMIRGGLVALGCEMAGARARRRRPGRTACNHQSGLLIHDDIMDRDPRRRGGPSVHEQYARLAPVDAGGAEADHFGESLAICAGEIAIFLAFEALAGLPGPPRRAAEVQRIFAAEFGLVGLGQMLDIQAGAGRRALTESDVLDIYRYKTARYSFSLPLAAGWILGGGRRRSAGLEQLGLDLGLVFQIRTTRSACSGARGRRASRSVRHPPGEEALYAAGLLDRATGADGDRSRLFSPARRPQPTSACPRPGRAPRRQDGVRRVMRLPEGAAGIQARRSGRPPRILRGLPSPRKAENLDRVRYHLANHP
jgi:geranylgeranyl diphosphate synthase type I